MSLSDEILNKFESMEPKATSYKGWKITVRKKKGTNLYGFKIQGVNYSSTQSSGFTESPGEAMQLAKQRIDSMERK